MKTGVLFAFVLVGGFAASYADAAETRSQQSSAPTTKISAAAVLQEIQEQAKNINQLRNALESTEPEVRVAAFKAMVSSGDVYLAEIAINTAFASADQTMKSLAFRVAFAGVSAFDVDLSLHDKAVESDMRTLYAVRSSEGATAHVTQYDVSTGKFEGKRPTHSGKVYGQMLGTAFTFVTPECGATLENKHGTWEFNGRVRCESMGNTGVFIGKFVLR